MVSALRPDGIILTPPLCDNAQVLKALRDSGTPFVLVSPAHELEGTPSVRMDDVRAAEAVTNLLISVGHTRIAFIKGAPDQAATKLRFKGYLRALKTHQIAVDEELIYQGGFLYTSGVEAAHHLLSRRVRPSAVFASSDDMALGVLATAQRLGLGVPADLSIAGFDDSPASAQVWPPLTTVRQPKHEMSRAAVGMITAARRSDAEAAQLASLHRVLPHELIVRDSTGAPFDKAVAAARRRR